MGLWASDPSMVVATQNQVWRHENALQTGQTLDGKDRDLVARDAVATGDLDIRAIAVDAEGRIVFVNTLRMLSTAGVHGAPKVAASSMWRKTRSLPKIYRCWCYRVV